MSRCVQTRRKGVALPLCALALTLALSRALQVSDAFVQRNQSTRPRATHSPRSGSTSVSAINKRNKFNKQKDLAAKMAEAKRQRELGGDGPDGGDGDGPPASSRRTTLEKISEEDIKLRNDQRRFADLLENSLINGSGGDFDKGFYLTVEQENENADAVFRGVVRLYEGDPAPTNPFAELLSIENGEPIGKGGMKRLVPWEGSRSTTSADYLVVITDPRPKSIELRTAMRRLNDALNADVLKKCLIINTDTPSENRRFLKKNFGEEVDLRILCDENMEWMREYTALGEKRFSMTMFVLRDGRVEKIAREVDAELLPVVVKNSIRDL